MSTAKFGPIIRHI